MTFKSLVASIAACAVLAFASITAFAALPGEGRRVALVIGNANYQNTVALPNTANDASAVAQSLTRLGFDVITGVDQTQNDMNRAMKQFARKLSGAEVGLFYYAGHGMQVAGSNYLIPVDAALAQETDLEFEAVKVNTIVERLLAQAKIKIVILDSCRDNPLAATLAQSMGPVSRSMSATSGLSAMSASTSGTMIAFATGPGKVALDGDGRHSPFTAALLNHLETPGLDIDVMMKRVRGQVAQATDKRQQPWTNSALNGEFFFKAPLATQQVASLSAPTTAMGTSGVATAPTVSRSLKSDTLSKDTLARIDLAAWDTADRGGRGTEADYKAYLTRFPSGLFSSQARAQLMRLANSNTPAASSQTASLGTVAVASGTTQRGIGGGTSSKPDESALGLSRNDWRKMQRQLTDLGFSTRGIDGRPGNGTRTAVRNWQSARGLVATGFFNASQRISLLSETVPEHIRQARRKSEQRTIQRASNKSRRSGKRKRRSRSGGSGSGIGTAIGVGIGLAVGCKLIKKC